MKSLEYNSRLADELQNSHLIDTLPYIDPWSESLKSKAEAMIKAEMSAFTPKNYLSKYDTPFKEFSTIPVQSFEIQSRSDAYHSLDMGNQLALKLEHSNVQKQNLEIIEEFTEDSYKKHIEALESLSKKLDFDIQKLENKNLEINKQRKMLQESKKAELKTLQETWKVSIGKNIALKEKLLSKQAILNEIKQEN